jgi:hypothetical protein
MRRLDDGCPGPEAPIPMAALPRPPADCHRGAGAPLQRDRRRRCSGASRPRRGRARVLDGSGALVALATPRATPPEGELPVDPVLHPDIVLLETAGGG